MKSGRFGFFTAGVLIVGALALSGFRWLAAEAVYPIERAGAGCSRGVWRRVTGLFSGASLAAENVRLKREVAELRLACGDRDRLEAENVRLRKALDYRARSRGSWIAAGILSSGGGAAGVCATLRVDKGSLAGVAEGAVVAAPEGLVGRIVAVSPHTAEVALVTDPSVKVSCAVGDGASGGAHGILSGGDSDVLLLRHLHTVGRLALPARVVTSGLGGVFPPGLDVGVLQLVTNGVRGVEGEVRPCVDYASLEDVFIRREN